MVRRGEMRVRRLREEEKSLVCNASEQKLEIPEKKDTWEPSSGKEYLLPYSGVLHCKSIHVLGVLHTQSALLLRVTVDYR
jgi:hypothetical protein